MLFVPVEESGEFFIKYVIILYGGGCDSDETAGHDSTLSSSFPHLEVSWSRPVPGMAIPPVSVCVHVCGWMKGFVGL